MNFMFHVIHGMASFPLAKSIIFQDGHIAPPTRYEKPWLEETAHPLVIFGPKNARNSRNSPECGYKWRFLAGKIIHVYGPSIPWQTVSHNQRVYPQIE